ncbi:MAG TPA: C25 family cysteine peptidase [Thermoanaerobaculia bacterium]|nr:C25 family cysteine peptidase [Thermoanaerobaculia bacterium]
MFRRAAVVLCSLFAAALAEAQTQFVYDSFTGTTGTFLESHTPDVGGTWTRTRGLGLYIQGNEVRPDKTTADDVYLNSATPPSADYAVGIDAWFIADNSNNLVELYARVTGGNGYSAMVNARGGWSIVRYVGGVATTLASGTSTELFPSGTDNEVVFYVTDSIKRLIVNGVVVGSTTDNTITAAGTTGFGLSTKTKGDARGDDFYAATLGPTAVRMDAMRATRDGANVLLSWSTGFESDNLGYRIWREDGRKRVCLTPSAIAGSAFFVSAPQLGSGTSYRWLDRRARRDATYWIEELDVHGKREWHGPIEPEPGVVDPATVPAPTFETLAERHGVVRNVETLHELRSDVRASHFDVATREALKFSVTTPGIHEVPLPVGADPKRVQLWEDGRELPIVVTANAARFYGTPLDSAWSAARVYWMTWDRGSGARIASASKSNAPLHTASGFLATVERREKALFSATTESEAGDGFFGPLVTTTAVRQSLRLDAFDRSAASAELGVTLYGSGNAPHRVNVTLNGNPAGAIEFAGHVLQRASFTIPTAWLRDGDNEIALASQLGWDDVSVVEAVRMTYSRAYRATNGTLVFTAPGGTRVRVDGFSAAITAFDITNPAAPVLLANDGNVISVAGSGQRTVIAADRMLNAAVAANERSDLTKLKASHVMIAPRAFLPALAGRGGALAAVEDVYDEFSYGAKDPAAIRAFLDAVRPTSVLLAGDGSFDPRGYVGGAAMDVLPVKLVRGGLQRMPSDAWFTDFDDDGAADIAIGRLPARTPAELQAMVAKIVAYENAVLASRDVVFVNGSGFDVRSAHATAYVNVDREGVTAARQNLLQRWDAGAALIDFTGHGSVAMWQSGSFFTSDDAAKLQQAPLVVAMTCLNGYFHDVYQESLAESLLRNTRGGAVGVWALTTLTEPRGQSSANAALVDALTRGATLGEATVAAQRATTDPDVRRALVLFGDPSMKFRSAAAQPPL